jgi:hypothetical protein
MIVALAARRLARLAALAGAAAALLSLLGCGSKLPEIAALEWRLETRPAETGPDYESLSVFASVKDEDGLDNIGELWVVNDDSALAWKLIDADWVKIAEGGDTWIGASALAGPDLAGMPRGSYRMVVIDAAGQRAEKEFRVSGNFPDHKAPTASFSDGKLAIASTWPETLALCFDGTGALIASPGALPRPASLDEALGHDIAARTAELGAYGYDPTSRMGAFSKRVKTR